MLILNKNLFYILKRGLFKVLYKTIDDVYRNVKQFIEEVYNKKRLHSSIGYKPPLEFEQEQLNTTAIFD